MISSKKMLSEYSKNFTFFLEIKKKAQIFALALQENKIEGLESAGGEKVEASEFFLLK